MSAEAPFQQKCAKPPASTAPDSNPPTFIDVFAGCGGLSLGLMMAGWKGLFAIEKDPFAFESLKENLVKEGARYCFDWPSWLPKEPICAVEAISKHEAQLIELAGSVDMLVGGPPCQGYSSAGRRDPKDPRNQLFASYLRLVELLKPKLVLVENVRGMTLDFEDSEVDEGRVNYAKKLVDLLSKEYVVSHDMLNLSTFGVPQNRSRYFLIAIRKDYTPPSDLEANPFEKIESERLSFLRSKKLTESTSARAALSDLEVERNGTVDSTESKGFKAINYREAITPYQKLMRGDLNQAPSDLRLANHREKIRLRFAEIIAECHEEGRLNVSLSKESRESYGLKKRAIRVLDPDRASPTVTSMPDDLLHYAEARTLTVRENARLQSFPDWFEFKGKYTTGGHRRRVQVPRFTQVANAVPPMAAEAIGASLLDYVGSVGVSSTSSSKLAPSMKAESSSKMSRKSTST